MKNLQSIVILLTMLIGLLSCSKESDSPEDSLQGIYLKFAKNSNNKDTVLYSN